MVSKLMQNPWDKLADKFNTGKPLEKIDGAAADNIYMLWPPIIKLIKKHFPNKQGLTALEYGCGSGGFAKKLQELGFGIIGMDSSPGMIETAKKNYPEIEFITGGADNIPQQNFDLVTAIMVFQFIEEIEPALQKLTSLLKPRGLFIFAVHNPEYAKSNPKIKNATLTLGNIPIPIYIRAASDYDKILQKLGLRKTLEQHPKFTKEYLEKYPTENSSISEYLLLGYKK